MPAVSSPDRSQLEGRSLLRNSRSTYALVLAIIAVVVSSCGILSGPVDGSGTLSTERYEVGDFVAIDVGDDLQVQIEFDPDSEPGLEITIDDNLHEQLNVRTVGDRLTVEPENGSDIRPTVPVVLVVSGYDVTSLGAFNDASIDTTVPAANAVDIRLDDGGEITATVDTDTLTIDANNDAELDLSGRADNIEITSDNDANARLSQTQVVNATVRAANDATIEIEASGSITGTAESDAIIRTAGDAAVDVTTSDDAQVESL